MQLSINRQPAQNILSRMVLAPRPAARALQNLWTWPRSILLEWAYPAAEKRDLRLDLLRGYAVIVMVANHLGGASWFYLITGGNAFYVSGAEAFIFISGLVVGMVYGGIALKQGIRVAQIKALQRAWTLYRLNVILTLLFAAASLYFGLEWAKDMKIDDPLVFLFNVVTLRQTIYLVDIPLMYTLLMATAAGALWLLFKGHTGWLLAGSGALWLAFQLGTVQVPWPVEGNTIFNFAAWQLLFFGAMAIGFHRQALTERLSQLPRWPYFALSGLLFVWLLQLYSTNGAFLSSIFTGLDTNSFMSNLFLKSSLAPGRLIASFIVFQFAYLVATLFWKPIGAALGWLLMPLGQNALYAYTIHVLVVGALYIVLPRLPVDIHAMGTINTSLQLLVLLALWAMIQRQFLFRIIPR